MIPLGLFEISPPIGVLFLPVEDPLHSHWRQIDMPTDLPIAGAGLPNAERQLVFRDDLHPSGLSIEGS